MNRLKTIIVNTLLFLGVIGVSLTPVTTTFAAVNPQAEICAGTGGSGGAGGCSGNTTTGSLTSVFRTIVNILLYVIGALAVIMIIFGAFRYVTSGGNSSSVTAAKNTIIYAVVGLIVAILAYAIVNFVISSVK